MNTSNTFDQNQAGYGAILATPVESMFLPEGQRLTMPILFLSPSSPFNISVSLRDQLNQTFQALNDRSMDELQVQIHAQPQPILLSSANPRNIAFLDSSTGVAFFENVMIYGSISSPVSLIFSVSGMSLPELAVNGTVGACGPNTYPSNGGCPSCGPGAYSFGQVPLDPNATCQTCPLDLSSCVRITNTSLIISEGAWFQISDEAEELPILLGCPSCLQTICAFECSNLCNISCQETLCGENYEERLCSECTKGSYKAEGRCFSCNNTAWIIPTIGMLLFLMIIFMALHQKFLGFLIELLLLIAGYLINFSPLWVIGVMALLILIYALNCLPRLKRAIRRRSFAELNHTSIGEQSPLSHELVKSFTFYTQMVTYLVGTNTIKRVLPSVTEHGVSGLECISFALFGSALGRFLLFWLLPFLALFVSFVIGTSEWGLHLFKVRFGRRLLLCFKKRTQPSPTDSAGSSSDRISEEDQLDHPLLTSLDRASSAGLLSDSDSDLDPPSLRTDPGKSLLSIFKRNFQGFFFFCFLIYSELTGQMFDVLRCDEYGYMKSNPWILCSGSIGRTFQILAIVMLIIYTIGLLVLASYLLYREKSQLHEPAIKAQIGFLYEAYREEFFWWEIPSFVRRLVLIVLVIFLPAHSIVHGLSIGGTLIFLMILQQWLKPFRGSLANWMEIFALASLLLLFISNEYLIASTSSILLNPEVATQLDSLQKFITAYDSMVSAIFVLALLLPLWGHLRRAVRRCCFRIERPRASSAFSLETDSPEQVWELEKFASQHQSIFNDQNNVLGTDTDSEIDDVISR